MALLNLGKSILWSDPCRAARFKGFQQQDSQELLRYLLDGMRAEEQKVCFLFVTTSYG